jgi:DNA-binding response OmpR family regulator
MPTTSLSSQTILVVDDDLDTLKLVGTTLEKQGYTIVAAKDGVEALEKVAQSRPDIILLDIMMPKMDGYDVTRRLRANPETANIPIILFTAKGQVDDKVAGLEVGADEYLTKPTHPAELIARVRNLLKRPSQLVPEGTKTETVDSSMVIGVMAGKGGQGVSTLAVNLATGFQQQFNESQVILAELRPGRGDISIQFGYKETQALNDLLKKKSQDIQAATVESALINHKSGLKLLLSSSRPSDVGFFSSSEQMAAVVSNLAKLAPYVVLDLGVGLHTSTQRALDYCTKLMIVAEPEIYSLRHTKNLLEDLNRIGFPTNKIMPVMVHRVRSDTAISAAEIQRILGLEVTGVFTPAPELVFRAAQTNQSMLGVDPSSFTAQQTLKLVKLITTPVGD